MHKLSDRISKKCQHDRNPFWCVECNYHSSAHPRDMEENPIDTVEMMHRNRANHFQFIRKNREDNL